MMGHGHSHGHSHGPSTTEGSASAAGRHRWRLAVAFAVIGVFFVVELVAGVVSGSLALISDAGHMAADVVALGAALAATTIATRPDRSGRRTYGRYRAEVFASGLAVLLMLGVAVFIAVEAVHRWSEPVEPASSTMIIVGVLGLIANIVSLLLLRSGAKESLNVKGAYLEVVADTIGSVGVIVAGVVIGLTGQPIWDTVIAALIAAYVAVRAVMLAREVLAVLGQHAPPGVDPEQVATALGELPGVVQVHDLHLWTLTSGMNVATAHLVTDTEDDGALLERSHQLLADRFAIDHATVQIEVSHRRCRELSW